jgi:magnesium-transporting ATPase (P-type)
MEGALLSLALKASLQPDALRKALPRDDEIPFDPAHRFVATLHHSHADRSFIVAKGAPEQILAMCATERASDGRERGLAEGAWLERIDALARGGHRVLAFGSKPAAADKRSLSFDDAAGGFTLLGLVGLIDPLRPEAVAAVAECKAAGIAVKMITGDHGTTAAAIARQLGLHEQPRIVPGPDLDAIGSDRLRSLAGEVCVFARTSPTHKLRLVEALQADGAVVAMTGDGVNDAPALKRADVGVAMGGKGTEAAKQAAEMVLADDNFASIVAAVREGRTVYDNITKVIAWTLPTNGGEAFTIIGALLLGFALPMTPIQILWINMVTAIALGLTLAFEPTEPAAMARSPRAAQQPLLTGRLAWRIVFVSALFVLASFGVFSYAIDSGASIEKARTIVVNTIVVLEIFYLFSVRYVHGTSLSWRGALGTPAVLAGVGLVTIAQFAFTYLPVMQRVFVTEPLSLVDGLLILAVGLGLLIVVEIEKRLARS